MECSEPGAIRDEELVAYLAGESVRPAVIEHLTHCQRCTAQMATYNHVELELISKLYRWDCPPNHLLGEYQMGMLPQKQAVPVKNHLLTCTLCTAEIVTLAQFLANDPRLVEATPQPQKAVSAVAANNHHPVLGAKRVMEQLREQSLAGARRIIATLAPQQPRLAYQRNASSQPALWPRRYEAEDISVSIQVEPGANRKDALQLVGFVTRKGTALEDLQGIPVQLSVSGTDDKAVYTQAIDDLGNFVFSALVPATYMLELELPEGVVVVDQLVVTIQE